jgi:hypothetical protein
MLSLKLSSGAKGDDNLYTFLHALSFNFPVFIVSSENFWRKSEKALPCPYLDIVFAD